MAGSTIGRNFRVTTWGEAQGDGIGVVIDGVPAGLELSENRIQNYLGRRRPLNLPFTANRHENDFVTIHSGLHKGMTTGAPISMTITNSAVREKQNDAVPAYRPGTGDYAYEAKYGEFDPRDCGRASGRETAARVAAGAVAAAILERLGVGFCSYVSAIGPVAIRYSNCSTDALESSAVNMPDPAATEAAVEYLKDLAQKGDSAGGIVEVIVSGVPAGIGEPVFDKLDAELAKAVMSIGSVKGVEIGDGFKTAGATATSSNDLFARQEATVKLSNHAGGMLGGISDGSEIVLRAAVKPAPFIAAAQQTVDINGQPATVAAGGPYDIDIAPRAVVVVEAMTAITLVDLIFENMTARMDRIEEFYKK